MAYVCVAQMGSIFEKCFVYAYISQAHKQTNRLDELGEQNGDTRQCITELCEHSRKTIHKQALTHSLTFTSTHTHP